MPERLEEDTHRLGLLRALVVGAAPPVVGEQMAERSLSEDVGEALLGQQARLHILTPHQVHHEPRAHDAQQRLVRRLAQRPLLVEWHAAHACDLDSNQMRHLRRDEQRDRLARAHGTHPEGTLRKVAEGHVLAEGHRRLRRERLSDVDSRRVHLIEEGEAPVRRDAAAGEGEHAEAGAKQDDLAVLIVEEDDPLHSFEAVREQVACHLQVGQPGDEGARVDERVEGRHVRGHRVEESDHGPIMLDEGVAHHRGCRQDREHLGVVALLVDAPAEVRREQIGGRAAEAEAAPKEGGGPEVLPIGGELQGLVLHREGEGEVLEVVLHRVREPAEELIQDVHLLGIERIEELQRPQVEHRPRRTAAFDARCAGRHVAREQGRGGVGRLGHG